MAYNKTSEERKRQAKKLDFLFIWSDDLCFGCSSDRSDRRLEKDWQVTNWLLEYK